MKYVLYALVIAISCAACRTRHTIVRDTRENAHSVAVDTTRHEGRFSADTIRAEHLQERADSLREREDERIEIDYNDQGKPAVIRIHRERTSHARTRSKVEQFGARVSIDSITISSHVGGTEREVETVAHERTTRDIGFRPWLGVVIRLLILLALFLIIKKIGLWQLIRSMFSSQ